jgi:hypothetical protein
MAQYISKGSLFGRIGSGFAKGLSEQVPKEIERNRLASGLKSLGEQKGLSPFQQYSGLVAAAHEYPEIIRSGAELLKHQSQRQNYANRGAAEAGQRIPRQLDNVDFANLNNRQGGNGARAPESSEIPQGNYAPGEPQIVDKNPLSPELQPAIRWTPEERDAEIGRVWDQNPQLTFPEVSQIVADNERRYLEAPEDYRKQQQSLEETQEKVNKEIEDQIRKKLHIPKGEEIFSKLPGETQNRIERGVAKDLRKNPNATVKDLVNTWTDRALNNAKDKTELAKLANRSLDEKLFKKTENLEKLKSKGKSFKEFGNSEEYYNFLKDPAEGIGLSPEGAASIAYELSKPAASYINKIEESTGSNFEKNAIKYAADLGDYLSRDDSILSIAKNIKDKDPFFDIKTFMSEIRKNQDELGLSPVQKREIETRGVGDFFPNWGDVFLFPKFGRG